MIVEINDKAVIWKKIGCEPDPQWEVTQVN
jgi:hypothetical protein